MFKKNPSTLQLNIFDLNLCQEKYKTLHKAKITPVFDYRNIIKLSEIKMGVLLNRYQTWTEKNF